MEDSQLAAALLEHLLARPAHNCISAVDWFKFRIEILKEASLSNYVCLVLLRILAAACSTFGPKGPRVERDMLHATWPHSTIVCSSINAEILLGAVSNFDF